MSQLLRSLRPLRNPSFVAIALLAVFAASCGGSAPPKSSQPQAVPVVQPDEVAPDFSLPQAAGGSVRLSDLRGEATLLYFSMGPG